MSLEEAARTELLRIRKSRDGATVAALARTDAIRQVLGGGDPRIAYNALKHILLNSSDDLAVIAASYSLGFASDGTTHLDRLTEFGQEHGYDQRQARRYSDKGILAVARQIGTEWVVEASPLLRVIVICWDSHKIGFLVQTKRHDFVEMREPKVELVQPDGSRMRIAGTWKTGASSSLVRASSGHFGIDIGHLAERPALSISWIGEIWPLFDVKLPADAGSRAWRVTSMATRVQVVRHDNQATSPEEPPVSNRQMSDT